MKSIWPKSASSLTLLHMIRGFSSTTVGPTEPIPILDIHTKVKDLISHGLYRQTLELYKQELHPSSLFANSTLLPSIIKACSSAQSQHFGLQLHCMVLKSGSDSDPVVSNSLISMYAKFSYTQLASQLFDTMPHRDTISWNSIITCYVRNGYRFKALEMFKEMYMCGFVPKPELVASIVSLCAQTRDCRLGRVIHALAIIDERIIEESVLLSTALVDLYFKCHDLLMAFHVFDRMEVKNEVSWTAMISGCNANQNYKMAINYFRAMQSEGVEPNRVTLLTVLPACAALVWIKHGKEIHGYAIRHGFDSDPHLSAALIHMYCKCREALHPAKIIFERSKVKDVVIWSSIIGSYSQSGNIVEAMKFFSRMRVEGIKPNSVTLLVIISVCTALTSLSHGYGVHGYLLKSGLNFDVFIGNALINMYSKCGCLMASHQVFKEMPVKDSVSWSSLISAYGLHGHGEEALRLFHEMEERGMEPDGITFLAVLSACNHAGLVEEGQMIFNHMMKANKGSIIVDHYACIIDLLGRSGKLEDACEVVSTMPLKPSAKILSSLVSACKIHGRLEVAEMLAQRLIESEPENAANYALLSMVYAEAGNWLSVEEVRRAMRVQGLNKCYGFSRVEVEYESF